jgi:hypothetical protein
MKTFSLPVMKNELSRRGVRGLIVGENGFGTRDNAMYVCTLCLHG